MSDWYKLFLDPCAIPHDGTFQCVKLGSQAAVLWLFVVLGAAAAIVLVFECAKKLVKGIDTTRKRRSQILG